MAPIQMQQDLKGKTAIVTGASSGIGKEVARGLAKQGVELILACRNPDKAAAVRDALVVESGNPRVTVMPLDLASLASVRAFVRFFSAIHSRLDILVNNAGGWTLDRETSADGIELTWATNVLGPELLTRLLLPTLREAGKARVVNLSSTVASGLDLEDVEFKKRKYSGFAVYSQTKQANRMLTWALAGELEGSGVTANAMSPGLVKTSLNRNLRGPLKLLFGIVTPLMAKSPAEGADTALWLASAPDIEGVSGKFWEKRKEIPCKFKADQEGLLRLKALCAEMSK